jgi:hypothetical protein
VVAVVDDSECLIEPGQAKVADSRSGLGPLLPKRVPKTEELGHGERYRLFLLGLLLANYRAEFEELQTNHSNTYCFDTSKRIH